MKTVLVGSAVPTEKGNRETVRHFTCEKCLRRRGYIYRIAGGNGEECLVEEKCACGPTRGRTLSQALARLFR